MKEKGQSNMARSKKTAHITFDATYLDMRVVDNHITNLPRWEAALWDGDPSGAGEMEYIQSIDVPTQDEINEAGYTYHDALVECQRRRNEAVNDTIAEAKERGYTH